MQKQEIFLLEGRRSTFLGQKHKVPFGIGHPPPSTHMDMHSCTHTHACVANIIISCKWLHPLGIPYDVICACVCMHAHVCACVWGHPLTIPHPDPPTSTPQGGPPESVKIQKRLNWLRYFNSIRRFEICGDFPTHGWVYSLVGGLIGGVRSKH